MPRSRADRTPLRQPSTAPVFTRTGLAGDGMCEVEVRHPSLDGLKVVWVKEADLVRLLKRIEKWDPVLQWNRGGMTTDGRLWFMPCNGIGGAAGIGFLQIATYTG